MEGRLAMLASRLSYRQRSYHSHCSSNFKWKKKKKTFKNALPNPNSIIYLVYIYHLKLGSERAPELLGKSFKTIN